MELNKLLQLPRHNEPIWKFSYRSSQQRNKIIIQLPFSQKSQQRNNGEFFKKERSTLQGNMSTWRNANGIRYFHWFLWNLGNNYQLNCCHVICLTLRCRVHPIFSWRWHWDSCVQLKLTQHMNGTSNLFKDVKLRYSSKTAIKFHLQTDRLCIAIGDCIPLALKPGLHFSKYIQKRI